MLDQAIAGLNEYVESLDIARERPAKHSMRSKAAPKHEMKKCDYSTFRPSKNKPLRSSRTCRGIRLLKATVSGPAFHTG